MTTIGRPGRPARVCLPRRNRRPGTQEHNPPAFRDKHYAVAVAKAFKCVDNNIKKRSGRFELDCASLMTTALSVTKPVLKINLLKGRSEQDQQLGYLLIAQGAMTGIRHPRRTSMGIWTILVPPSK